MTSEPTDLPEHEASRAVDRWLGSYANDHQHRINQAIHLLCVPLILWSVTALLWLIPVPATFGRAGLWMAAAMFLAWLWYWRLSRSLGLGMLAVFVLFGFLNNLLYAALADDGLLWLAGSVFVLAWIGQFIGHLIEGKRPSFFTDVAYLLVGPLWTLDKLYRLLGIAR